MGGRGNRVGKVYYRVYCVIIVIGDTLTFSFNIVQECANVAFLMIELIFR